MIEPATPFFEFPWGFRTVAMDINEAKILKREMEKQLVRLNQYIYSAEHEPEEAEDESGTDENR